jgi:hypothetical protein
MADRDTEISRDGTPGARTSIPGAEASPRSRERRKLEVHTELRVWLYPFLLLAGASVLVILLGRLLDADGRGGTQPALRALFSTPTHDPTELNANVGAIVTGILGVAISVVAIIVELASNRYTHRITGLFFRAPVNFAVLGIFVVSGIQGMWVAFGVRSGFVPVWGTTLAMGLMTLSLLLLLPYFAFVFDFLDPLRIVARIRAETLSVITRGPRLLIMARMSTEDVQRHAADGAEQLADVVLNAMSNHDGTIAVAAVNALGDLALDYAASKSSLPLDFFTISEPVAANPDFVSMAPEVLQSVSAERTWFEFKILRQYQQIYQSALGSNRELCYVVAIQTRALAAHALEVRDERLVDLCIKFFNTYFRATVNARDVRTAYNVFNQYRLLGEACIRMGLAGRALEVARYFKYYGQLAFQTELPFVLETVAHDLCALNELAFDLSSGAREELLRIFLQVDKEGEGATQEASLKGVRKAQVKLATYYLLHGDEAAARRVFDDMRQERPARLASIRDELLGVTSQHFWEITDRGKNFDFIPPLQKEKLQVFFEWFGPALPPPGQRMSAPRAEAPPVSG